MRYTVEGKRLTLTNAYVTKGPSGDHRVDNDYYPTPPIGTLSLLMNHDVPLRIWEPAAGRGHISKELIRNGHEVVSTDLVGYENPLVDVVPDTNFLECDMPDVDGVVTNPPFKHNLPEKLIDRVLGRYDFLALFCRLTFMESKGRYRLFTEKPPSDVYVMSRRINCNEKYWDQKNGIGGMVAYGWFVWDYRYSVPGSTKLKWVDPMNYVEELE